MPLLLLKDVTAGYSKLPVIQEISMHTDAAQIVSILGPNGSGKSTLLKAVAGLLKPSGGSVRFDGEEIAGWTPHKIARRGLAYVPQLHNTFPSMSVVENLEMGGFTRSGKEVSRLVDGILSSFPDLALARKKRAIELSVGQRNLLAIARGMMLRPKLLLADEPTAGLAPRNRALIWRTFDSIVEQGVAVLVVEQDVDGALDNSRRAYILTSGRNRLDGNCNELRGMNLDSVFLGIGNSSAKL